MEIPAIDERLAGWLEGSCFLSSAQKVLNGVNGNDLPPLHLDKEAAERLSKTVDEACLLLAEYNGRLAAELEDRRQLARMLIEYTQNQKDVLTEKEKKLEVSVERWVHGMFFLLPGVFLKSALDSCNMTAGLCCTSWFSRERRPAHPHPSLHLVCAQLCLVHLA